MYQSFYGFSDDPFRMSPCTDGCFAHRTFAKANAYIIYTLQRADGILVLTGSPGLGKTTLLRNCVNRLEEEEGVSFVEISGDCLAPGDFLYMVAHRFGLDCDGLSVGRILTRLEAHLVQLKVAGRRGVLLIDEAQDLDISCMNEIKSLSNLEHQSSRLLQIFLVGQNSLMNCLRKPELEALLQRVTAACQLKPSTREEVVEYIVHRLNACGWQGNPSFDDSVADVVYKHSSGNPRRINLICSRLLLRGMMKGSNALTSLDAKVVLDELNLEGLGIDHDQPKDQVAAIREANQ